MTDPVDLPALAKALLLRRGPMTLRDAAKQAGVNFSTLSRIENGKFPDLETFSRLCQWLQISPEVFLNYQPPKPVMGRPRKDPEHARVVLACRVHPDALQIIDRVAEVLKITRGEAVDQIAYFYAIRGPQTPP